MDRYSELNSHYRYRSVNCAPGETPTRRRRYLSLKASAPQSGTIAAPKGHIAGGRATSRLNTWTSAGATMATDISPSRTPPPFHPCRFSPPCATRRRSSVRPARSFDGCYYSVRSQKQRRVHEVRGPFASERSRDNLGSSEMIASHGNQTRLRSTPRRRSEKRRFNGTLRNYPQAFMIIALPPRTVILEQKIITHDHSFLFRLVTFYRSCGLFSSNSWKIGETAFPDGIFFSFFYVSRTVTEVS